VRVPSFFLHTSSNPNKQVKEMMMMMMKKKKRRRICDVA